MAANPFVAANHELSKTVRLFTVRLVPNDNAIFVPKRATTDRVFSNLLKLLRLFFSAGWLVVQLYKDEPIICDNFCQMLNNYCQVPPGRQNSDVKILTVCQIFDSTTLCHRAWAADFVSIKLWSAIPVGGPGLLVERNNSEGKPDSV